ncbi:hypothetical protein acdb102_00290 [Acidothermaceae bacterium B102]|nr:hypothetical protein acdb102_00290 [Acidothermaceae bacterium B102]
MSARVSAATVATGSIVTVTGTVAPRVAGISVAVQRLVAGHWLAAGAGKTVAKGVFSVNVLAPRKAGPWTIRAIAGTTAVSGTFRLTVTKTAYTITARLAAKTVPHGGRIVVTGSVRPKAKGSVQLQYLDGKVWRPLGTAKLTATSTFQVSGVRPLGLIKLRVVKLNTKTIAGGTSTTLKVTVRRVMTPVVTTTSLPGAIVGRPYTATLAARAGVGPYTWRVTTGGLPEGLTLSPAGGIGGVPLRVYTEAFGVTAIGSDGGRVTTTLSITVAGTSVTAWGSNASQQLVSATTSATHTPVVSVGLTKITAIAGGAYSAYALRADGTVWAWGDNSYGQLGNGGPPSERTNVPVQVSGLTDVVGIAAGNQAAYAQRRDGTVWAWGFNASGELGNGSLVNSNVPVQIRALTFIVKIAASAWNGYALRSDGTIYSWGFDTHGEVGNGTIHLGGVSTPVPITGLSNVTAIGGGGGGGYAVRNDGTVWAWGSNATGGLGNGTTTDSPVPVQVSGVANATAVAGGNTAGYALRTDGTVVAWGGAGSGQLGNGGTANAPTPVAVSGLTGATSIAAGGSSAYATKSDGTVWSWGGNGAGQLGNNTTTDSAVPVQVSGVSGAFSVAAGQTAAYALTSP